MADFREEKSSEIGWDGKRSDCQEAEGKDARVLTAMHMGVRAPRPLASPFIAGSSLGVHRDEQWAPW